VIAGSDTHYLRQIVAFRGLLAIEERIDGLDQIRLLSTDGADRRIAFPDAAYQVGLGANPSSDPKRLRLEYSSMARPATTFDYDLATGTLDTLKVQEIPSGYDAADYVTERLLAPGRDGVQIPISIVHRKDWARHQGKPLHLYGYGAYGLGMPPSFSSARISLLDRGFAYAIAHIRGGDELGYGWYEDGKLDKRTNTFNDFIDAARFLVVEGYAAPGGISTSGGSAGGQLMGVIANDAPELWRAIVAHVPFVDALNTMLDESLPLTPAEWPEWGDPIRDKAAFDFIRSYSPYDQVTSKAYPALMVTAGLNDPRVTYWEPAKWVAKLRLVKTDGNVLVLKTNMGAGHGGKSGRFERLREVAEEYAFLLDAFGLA
jgi:oligopeptidase B